MLVLAYCYLMDEKKWENILFGIWIDSILILYRLFGIETELEFRKPIFGALGGKV